MNNALVLVKAYYTLEETFDRLKRSGAELSRVNDLLQLAQEGKLKLSLLCNDRITLVNTKFAHPIEIKWPKYCDNYNVDTLISFDLYEPGEIGSLFRELELVNWLMCEVPRNENRANVFLENKKPFSVSFQSINDLCQKSILTPINQTLDKSKGQSVTFFGAEWLLLPGTKETCKELIVVKVGNEKFYVCRKVDNNPLMKGVKLITTENELKPSPLLYCSLENHLLKNSDYVVTDEEIIAFEQKYLGFKLKRQANNSTGVMNKQQQREEVLKSLIDSEGLDELIPLRRIGVWNKLAEVRPDLFVVQTDSKGGTLRSFFAAQNYIEFKRGR